MNEEKISLLNILLPALIIAIGATLNVNPFILVFLSITLLVFSVIPFSIATLSKMTQRQKDIFTYKYSTPLTTGMIIALTFIYFYFRRDLWIFLAYFILFVILHVFNHIYISKEYPEYYFKN